MEEDERGKKRGNIDMVEQPSKKQKVFAKETKGSSGKKKRNTTNESVHIPLPGTSLRFQEQIRTKYVGTFRGYAVWIEDHIQGIDLFESGFYGKGILSRSKPSWKPTNNRPNQSQASDTIQKEFLPRQSVPIEIAEIQYQQQRKQTAITKSSRDGTFHSRTRREFEPNNNNNLDEIPTVQQQNSLQVDEFLQLGLEEAFFLLYAMDCIIILNEEGEEMSIDSCWIQFKKSNPRFISSYLAYHHYRSIGWTPKYGTKYGSDWILYQKGPSFYHAEKTIIVVDVDENGKEMVEGQRKLTWLNILNLNRVSEQVKKKLCICFIHHPKDVDDISPDACLQNCKFEEMMLSRWMPSRTRETPSNLLANNE